eukprot:s3991_g7.t1
MLAFSGMVHHNLVVKGPLAQPGIMGSGQHRWCSEQRSPWSLMLHRSVPRHVFLSQSPVEGWAFGHLSTVCDRGAPEGKVHATGLLFNELAKAMSLGSFLVALSSSSRGFAVVVGLIGKRGSGKRLFWPFWPPGAMARIAPYSEDQPPVPAPSTAKKGLRMSMAPPTMEPEESRSKSSCMWLRNCREACGSSQFLREEMRGQAVRKFLRGRPFSIVAMIALFLALFLGEIFVVCQVPSNTEQDVVLTIVFALFIFEWVGLTLTDANYLFGFFFVMDCVGTASMVLDITYMFGPDAMAVEEVTEGASQDNVIVVRAARAAKLGARAGRLSRAVKLLKMLPGMSTKEDASKVKIARVISNQLNTVLSTRVAFLTICVVVVLPLFQMLQYPEMDDSMGTWAELLDRNAAS